MNFSPESSTTIIPREQSNFLWRISFCSLISAIYAYYRGHYDLVFVPGGVFLTSINYWRHPDYSWRRYIDMSYVSSALIYQIYRAEKSCTSPSRAHYYPLLLGIGCYPLGVYLYNKGRIWHSTYAHSMIHIFGNISNIMLYTYL